MSELSFRYGIVWFDTSPDQASFVPTGFKEMRIDQPVFSSEPSRSVCLRLFLPGLGDSFGVLGAQFTPMRQPETLIRVGWNQPEDEATTLHGLSEAQANTILSQAFNDLTLRNSLGSGLLLFDHAITHPVDSSSFVFRVLTTTLILLLGFEMPKTRDDITRMVNAVIKAENQKHT
jgi:hypothetical protein